MLNKVISNQNSKLNVIDVEFDDNNLNKYFENNRLKMPYYVEECASILRELEEKQQREQQKAKQQLDKVIEDTKKTIKDLIQQDMKDKALDLVMQIQKIMPEDMEIKELIKNIK